MKYAELSHLGSFLIPTLPPPPPMTHTERTQLDIDKEKNAYGSALGPDWASDLTMKGINEVFIKTSLPKF